MRKLRWTLIVVATLVVVATGLLLCLLLWGAPGSAWELVRGQRASLPRLDQPSVSLSMTTTVLPNSVRLHSVIPVARVAPEFVSFALDIAQIVGGKWWGEDASSIELGSGRYRVAEYAFDRPALQPLVDGLRPAYFRAGGSESDKVFLSLEQEPVTTPAGYESVLYARHWDAMQHFIKAHQLKFIFTLNNGPSSRDGHGAWRAGQAQQLMAYAAARGDRIDLWEMGNELNVFFYLYGPGSSVSPAQYLQDMSLARTLAQEKTPNSRIAGQASAIVPALGEPLAPLFGFMEPYLRSAGHLTDVVLFHYYPQQSRRGPVATRRASPSRMLNPDYLDELGYWTLRMKALRDQYAPGKPVWIGETGGAQFGGEPGISDAYLGGLWWLDELGLAARSGVEVVVRQTLSGSNYGLIDDKTLVPRPDYWNSWLWKRLMGQEVFAFHLVTNPVRRLRSGLPDSLGDSN